MHGISYAPKYKKRQVNLLLTAVCILRLERMQLVVFLPFSMLVNMLLSITSVLF